VEFLDHTTAVPFGEINRKSFDPLRLRRNAAALDFGCGTGDDIRMMREQVGARGCITSIALSRRMIEQALARNGAWILGIRKVTLIGLSCISLVSAGSALAVEGAPNTIRTPASAGPSENVRKIPSRDSVKRLPDWSGVWILSNESWDDVTAAMRGHDGGRVPLTPKYMAIRAANGAANDGNGPPGGIIDNSERCMPAGIPGIGSLPVGHEYLFTQGRVTVIFEDGEVRRIDTRSRRHPVDSELEVSFAGHSIGHWESNTLIVDTIGITSQAELFVGLRLAEKTHVAERIWLKDNDTLQIDTVVTNAEMFTTPYAYTRLYKRSKQPPLEYVPCTDNNRDHTTNGRQTDVDLTPPLAVPREQTQP